MVEDHQTSQALLRQAQAECLRGRCNWTTTSRLPASSVAPFRSLGLGVYASSRVRGLTTSEVFQTFSRSMCMSTASCGVHSSGCFDASTQTSSLPSTDSAVDPFGMQGWSEHEESCFVPDVQFSPRLLNTGRTETASANLCQVRCSRTSGCARFTWWRTGACYLHE